MTAVEKHVWLRAALALGAMVVGASIGSVSPASFVALWLVPAVTYVVLVRTLVGSLVAGALFGWLVVSAADLSADMGPEGFAYVAPLVPFAGAMAVAVFAALEWMVASVGRRR